MRKAFWILVGVLLAAPLEAQAQLSLVRRSGVWEVLTGRSNDGTAVCVLSTGGSDGRYFGLKYFLGNQHVTTHLARNGWNIPDGTPVPVEIRFGNETPWRYRGIGRRTFVEGRITADRLALFIREFRAAGRGQITFPQGSEGSWSLNLSGSSAAADAFSGCIRQLAQGAPRGPTQPFTPAPSEAPRAVPSQPFSPDPGPAPGPAPGKPSYSGGDDGRTAGEGPPK